MDRRVLILTYYFPPAGGPGVQRTLKFVKHLPGTGWSPVVLTVRQGAYPAHDPSLREDVPSGAEVHRTFSLDPHWVYARLLGRSDGVSVGSIKGRDAGLRERFAQWIRANVFLPDARVGWFPFAFLEGRRLLERGDIDVIVTSGPPHSTHLSGAALQWSTGVPWLADFRDPWTDINYYQELPHTEWARRVDSALERMVLRRADAVTTVSPTWRRLLADKVTGTANGARFSVIENGFDEEDISPGAATPSEDVFEVTHVGSLYASRNPVALWEALEQLRDAREIPELRVRLVGTVDPNVREAIRAHGLEDVTEFVSYVPHAEAVGYMRQAGLLLLSIEDFPHAAGMITGKIYEYLASGRPVLGLGPPSGDAAALLRETEGGELFGRDDVEGVAEYIRLQYTSWREGRPHSGASSEALTAHSRKSQTEALARILDELAGVQVG